MSEFFDISNKLLNEVCIDKYSFTINWFALTYGAKMLYKNASVKNNTCYNESLGFETHFDIIVYEEYAKIEFADFYFRIRIEVLANLAISNEKCVARDLKFYSWPHEICSDKFLRDEYLIEINLTFGDKS